MNDERIKLRTDIETDEAARGLEVLKAELSDVNKELKAMGKYSEEWSDEQKARYQELKAEQKDLKDEFKEFARAIDVNDASMNELTTRSRQLHQELRQLKIGSEEWLEKLEQVKEVDGRIASVKGEVKDLSEAMSFQQRILGELKDGFLGTFAALQLSDVVEEIVDFGKEAVKAAAEVDDAFSDVMKSANMTREQVEALNESLKNIDTRTSQEALLDIAKVGGQIGIVNEQMLGFVESVDKANVALGDEFKGGVEEVASTMGTLAKLFDETKKLEAGVAINQIGSAINELGAAGSATGPVVADFATRLGQLGNLAPKISETLGLGAAFQELGLSAEIAAGGITNILLGAAKSADAFAEQMGKTTLEVENLINTNPNKFLLELAASFKDLSNTEVAKRLDEMGIKSQEATKVMQLLATQTEWVAKKQGIASKAMEQATSLTKEFATKNKNAAAELDKAKKSFENMKVEIGMGLMPAVSKGITAFVSFINILRGMPGFLKENSGTLLILAGSLVAMNINMVIASANSLRLAAAERARAIATGAVTVAQRALNFAMTANPIGLVIGAIGALVAGFVALYNHSQTVRAGINGLWQAMKTAADVAVQFVKAFLTMDIKSMADVMMNGGKKVGAAFSKGYEDQIKSEAPKAVAAHKKKNDDLAGVSKDGGKKAGEEFGKAAGEAELKEHDRTQTTKEKKNAKHTADQIARAKEAAIKQAEDALESETKLKADTDKLKIEAIKDEKDRKLALLKWEFEQKMADIEKEKASEATKALFKKALTTQYETERAQIESEARKDREAKDKETAQKIADHNKETAQKIADNDKRLRDEQVKSSYDAAKAVNDFELLMAGNNANAILAVKRNRLQIEKTEELRQLDEQYQAKVADLNKRKADDIRTAQESGQSTTEIRFKYAELDRSLKEETDAKKKALEANYQKDVTELNQQALEARKAQVDNFFGGLKSAMSGDFSYFQELLNKKTGHDKDAQNQRLQDFSNKTQEIGDIALKAVNFMKDLNQKYLEKQEANIKKEKDAAIEAVNEKINTTKTLETTYDKEILALKEKSLNTIDKNEKKALEDKIDRLQLEKAKTVQTKKDLETKIDDINKNAEDKLKAAKKEAFERDKRLQIAMALISGGMAFIKALASGFFPVNLVFAAATAAATAIQIAAIKKQQFSGKDGGVFSSGYVKNAGILRGGWHGAEYGKGGISMIDRATGQEVGEAEGGEAFMILSRNTVKNNGPLINRLLNSSLHRNGQPVSRIRYRDGGIGVIPWDEKVMLRRGGRKAKRAQVVEMDDTPDVGSSGEISDDGKSAIAENTKVAKNTELNTEGTEKNTKELIGGVSRMIDLLERIAGKPNPPSAGEIGGAVGGAIRGAIKSNF